MRRIWGDGDFNGLSGHENNTPKISAKQRFDARYHRETIGSMPIWIIIKKETHRDAILGSVNFTLANDITHNAAKGGP